MRIGRDAAVAGKMLAHRFHAGFLHPTHVGMGEVSHRLGIVVERTVADDPADAVI